MPTHHVLVHVNSVLLAYVAPLLAAVINLVNMTTITASINDNIRLSLAMIQRFHSVNLSSLRKIARPHSAQDVE